MEKDKQKLQIEVLLRRCEKYFYRYLLTQEKTYIDKFFKTTKQIKRNLKLWKTH